MKNLIKIITLLTITSSSFAAIPTMECSLRNSTDTRPVIMSETYEDSMEVEFSRDIGVTGATTDLFGSDGSLALLFMSIPGNDVLDEDGIELFSELCGVDVETATTIEALIFPSQDFDDAICLSCKEVQ